MSPDWSSLAEAYPLDPEQIDRLARLFNLLKSVNDRNLTAVTSEESIFNVHFLDSLSLLRYVDLHKAKKVVDIGSGAGFPGLPLAIALPKLSVYLVEASKKKAEFIESSCQVASIKNAFVVNERAEEFGRSSLRGSFDAAVARAVAALPVVLEYTVPLLRVGGSAFLQRGARRSDDRDVAVYSAALLGAELARLESIRSYPGAKNLHVWVFNKTSETPDKYPRRPGMPAKKPLTP